MRYEKSCGAVVFDGEKVLVIKHCDGHVDFPKGHCEKEETEEETAIREVKEETNIDIVIRGGRSLTNYSPMPDVSKEVVFFLADKISGEINPQLDEILEVKWIPIDQVEDCLTYSTARELFRKILNEKRKLEKEK